ncbi:hypothetical protein GXP67_02135 [Rhodocytophaga rosea]|uniref:Uncharacterized protein n=1 Tax=Rhodocytophaga rosea TaxID=2704465 RepID=A0A6C0GCD8_9BACT|nr:hypothetical protein [Rhodocytophaga rosea]QHT65548.1 hypothetical protein GXP67_02135 [Rhodocytophaga rosea]
MKTLQLFSLSIITGLLTMSMGFPTELTKRMIILEEKPGTIVRMANGSTIVDVVEEEPILEAYLPSAPVDAHTILVKVFDIQGSLVMQKSFTIEEFLTRGVKASLPANSTFVMYDHDTAYYFLEAGSAQ